MGVLVLMWNTQNSEEAAVVLNEFMAEKVENLEIPTTTDDVPEEAAALRRAVYKCTKCGLPKRGHTCSAVKSVYLLKPKRGREIRPPQRIFCVFFASS